MKKALSLILALVMCFSIIPFLTASAYGNEWIQLEKSNFDPEEPMVAKVSGITPQMEKRIMILGFVKKGEELDSSGYIFGKEEANRIEFPAPQESGDYELFLFTVHTVDGNDVRTIISSITFTVGKSEKSGETSSNKTADTDSKPVTMGPGAAQASAAELKAGQNGTVTNAIEIAYYKINLSAASEVVITLSMPKAVTNEQVWIASIREPDGGNDMGIYGGPTGGPLAGRELSGSLWIGALEKETVLSKQGALYLNKGVYIIYIAQTLVNGNSATIKIDSITPVSNSGGWTKESAPIIDPAKAIVKQTRCHKEWSQDEYYWKFILAADATVSIKQTVKPVPSSDDRINASSRLSLLDDKTNPHFGNDIYGVVDGKEIYSLDIREKDAVLTKTITYKLPKGTYYVELSNGAGYPGTEYTLEFTTSGGASAKVGDPLGDVLYSDITAYINGHAIPTSIIAGKTLVVVEDLAKYGFNVSWNGTARTLKVELNKGKEFKPLPVQKDTVNKPGTFKQKYLYTDIKTYVSGTLVESYAINGVTLMNFDDLGKFGKFSWNGQTREIRLTLD